MTSQGTAHGRFQRGIHRRHVQAAEMAAQEMGGLSLADALSLCELLANTDPARYDRAALRWLPAPARASQPRSVDLGVRRSRFTKIRCVYRAARSRPSRRSERSSSGTRDRMRSKS